MNYKKKNFKKTKHVKTKQHPTKQSTGHWINQRGNQTRIYNGKKTNTLTSGAGKTGQPLVKEWN